ncbi:metallophosphoesterase [Desulfurivibrio alkaliphilus]|uniref:Metallophosphoesterase n=1 Tax=Desulfurivibrio alkaliphilus (strain DSM 19089 / UNIQEM U267 / AHT2) TaxID=589865 RepID=D6Z448_DESAT|nr:metallophosphoesterase [Desulfurivibrio alkaliphilus]ADH86323.1 metallophosphoesterase [Desulfurivibrio alkaliphilus AHT 2]
MLLFLSAFFLVYGSLHWLFYRLLKTAWEPGRWRWLLLFVLLLLTLAPVLVRLLERQGLEGTALVAAYAGFYWMGFVFLFAVAALLLSGLGWLLRYRRQRRVLSGDEPGRLGPFLPPAAIFKLALVFALAASFYGHFEARRIIIEEVRLASPKLADFAPAVAAGSGAANEPWPAERPLRIVKITDVHLGLLVQEARLAPMLAAVEQARPDILVATGDIVDGQGDGIAHLAAKIRRLEAPLGKFAILGNHEFYVGAEQSRAFLEEAGFTVLRGESVVIGNRLRIAGVDDRTGIAMGLTPPEQERELLAELPAATYNILLKHQPEIVPGGHVDLQLSGHVHRGQLVPFNFFTWLAYRVPTGLSRAEDGRYLYVGRGTGTWGPPVRFLAPPEVTLIKLYHQ